MVISVMDKRIEQLEQQLAIQSREIAALKRHQATSVESHHPNEIKRLKTHQELHNEDNNLKDPSKETAPVKSPPTSQAQRNAMPNVSFGAPPLFTTLNPPNQHPYSLNPLVHPPSAIPPTAMSFTLPPPLNSSTDGFLKPSKLGNRFSMPASKLMFPTNNQTVETGSLTPDISEESSEVQSSRDNESPKNNRITHSILETKEPIQVFPVKPEPTFQSPNYLSKLHSTSFSHKSLTTDCTKELKPSVIYISSPVKAEPGDDLKQYKVGAVIPLESFKADEEEDEKFHPIIVTVGPDRRFKRKPIDDTIKEPKFRVNKVENTSILQNLSNPVKPHSNTQESLNRFKQLLMNSSSFYSTAQGMSRYTTN